MRDRGQTLTPASLKGNALSTEDRTTRRALRWTVPVDDQWHQIGGGKVLHVDARRGPAQVEVWTLEETPADWPRTDNTVPRTVRVYGTGHPIADVDTEHIGSVIVADGALVWHVFGSAHKQSQS